MTDIRELRYFNYYDQQKRLTSQRNLFLKLEEIGYETNGKYILSHRKTGIPVTIMLLLMKDVEAQLVQEQKELYNLHKKIDAMTTEDLDRNFGIKTQNSLIASVMLKEPNRWDYNEVSFLDSYPTISGSVAAVQTKVLVPNNPYQKPLCEIFYSDNPKIILHKHIIEVKSDDREEKSMINVIKNTIQFAEFSYALKERVETEISNFNNLFSANIIKPVQGRTFNSVCMKRNDIIHRGNLNIEIDPKNNRIMFGKASLVDTISKTLNEACSWIEEIYNNMLQCLTSNSS